MSEFIQSSRERSGAGCTLVRDTSAEQIVSRKSLALRTWGGLRYYAVTVVGETKTRWRVRMEQDAILPGKRAVWTGECVLVPKFAVRDEPKRLQVYAYHGRVYGYGDPTKPFSQDCTSDLAHPETPHPGRT